MDTKLDLVEILKNCPSGIKLYSPYCGEVELDSVCKDCTDYPIVVRHNGSLISFTQDGRLYTEFLDGECALFPAKDQRDWSKFAAPRYKKEKFDPKTLKPFDNVLVRDSYGDTWKCRLFSHIVKHEKFPYMCAGHAFVYCIPYNGETKHLVGTAEEAPTYYRYWEEQS